MTWKRPENVVFPQVWWTFEARDPETDKIVKYRVEDLPVDRYDEAVKLMATLFIRDETMCKSLDLISDASFEGGNIWTKILEQKISVVCFKEGSSEICGLNLLEVLEKDVKEPEEEIPNKKIQGLIKALEFIKAKGDPYNRHGVDRYLHAMGLLIVPKYRGLGLATQILKARVPLGRAVGLKMSGTVFTGTASQVCAKKAGFIEDYSVLYEDLAKYEPFVEFPNISSPFAKFMSIRFDEKS